MWLIVEMAVVLSIGHCKAGDSGVPVDTSPAEIDVMWVVAHDERRRIGGVGACLEVFFFAQSCDVAWFARDTVPDAWFISVTGIENHDPPIGQNEKGRIVVIVGLEETAYKHIGFEMAFPIVFLSVFAAVLGVLAKIYGLITGKSDEEILAKWGGENL